MEIPYIEYRLESVQTSHLSSHGKGIADSSASSLALRACLEALGIADGNGDDQCQIGIVVHATEAIFVCSASESCVSISVNPRMVTNTLWL